jgi:hypothetical protein
VEAGATTINIPDTVGYATPSDFVGLLERVYREVRGDRDDVVVSVHCHNDLGLAVANSLSAIHAGARQIEGAINGIGERAGNTSIEEIIMAVKTRQDVFGVEIGADTTQIFETSRLVSRLTGYPVQFNKAVVGRNAFAHESGIHQHGVLRAKETYEIMDAASVGQEAAQIVLGKHSGRAGFADAIGKLGITLEDEAFSRAFEKFKQLADRKVQIGEEELRAIAEDEAVAPAHPRLRLVGLHVTGGNDVTPSATVRMEVNGAEREFVGQGDGMIHHPPGVRQRGAAARLPGGAGDGRGRRHGRDQRRGAGGRADLRRSRHQHRRGRGIGGGVRRGAQQGQRELTRGAGPPAGRSFRQPPLSVLARRTRAIARVLRARSGGCGGCGGCAGCSTRLPSCPLRT